VYAQSNPRPPSLQPLPVAERIQEESIIGLVPFSEFSSTAALDVPSIDGLLRGTSLMAPSIGEEDLSDPALVKRISDQVGQFLRGWFAQDLAPYIQLHSSLVPLQLREYYQRSGMNITPDEPTTAYYYMAFKVPPWQVQAVGQLDTFHCISLGRFLAQSEALQEGGHPAFRPLGPVESLLAQAALNLPLQLLIDHSTEHATNVYDTYLERQGTTVKAGVRQNLNGGGKAASSERTYYYGVRINLDLRSLRNPSLR
jgi:hypothetical protein